MSFKKTNIEFMSLSGTIANLNGYTCGSQRSKTLGYVGVGG